MMRWWERSKEGATSIKVAHVVESLGLYWWWWLLHTFTSCCYVVPSRDQDDALSCVVMIRKFCWLVLRVAKWFTLTQEDNQKHTNILYIMLQSVVLCVVINLAKRYTYTHTTLVTRSRQVDELMSTIMQRLIILAGLLIRLLLSIVVLLDLLFIEVDNVWWWWWWRLILQDS